MSTGPISVITVLERVTVAGVAAIAAGRVVLGVAEMLIHLDLQAGLEDLLGEITEQPSRADQVAPSARARATSCSAID